MSMNSATITSAPELAELAGKAAEGITCFLFSVRRGVPFSAVEECRSEIMDGITLCDILTKGYEIQQAKPDYRAEDITVWRAFQRASEEAGFDKSAIMELAQSAASVGEGLRITLNRGAASETDLSTYRRFFLRLALALGL